MYLSVHLVRRGGVEGINVFLHRHPRDLAWPEDAGPLADENPGTIVDQRVGLAPGGNEVRSYLDVLAPENTPRDSLERAIQALRHDLAERRNPTTFVHPQGPADRRRVTIRFGVEPGLENLREEQLMILWHAGSGLLARAQATGRS